MVERWGAQGAAGVVVMAAPNDGPANSMRAWVLSGGAGAWEVGPRSAAELREAAAHFDRTGALCDAPAVKAEEAFWADWCRSQAQAIPIAASD